MNVTRYQGRRGEIHKDCEESNGKPQSKDACTTDNIIYRWTKKAANNIAGNKYFPEHFYKLRLFGTCKKKAKKFPKFQKV